MFSLALFGGRKQELQIAQIRLAEALNCAAKIIKEVDGLTLYVMLNRSMNSS